MPRKEFELLARLATVPGRLSSREELLQDVYGYGDATDGRTLDVHVYRRRSKIEKDPAHPSRIVTVRGLGFLLNYSEPRARGTGTLDVMGGAAAVEELDVVVGIVGAGPAGAKDRNERLARGCRTMTRGDGSRSPACT